MPVTNPRPFEPVRVDEKKMDKIRKLYEAELENPTTARTRHDIPQDFDHISKEFLKDCIAPDRTDVELLNYKLGMSGTGTADRQQIFLEWNEKGKDLPKSVFCKATYHLNTRLNLCWGGLDSEIAWFNTYRHKVGITTPNSWFANFSPETYNSIVILDEIKGVDWCNYKTKVSRAMLEDMVTMLARLHATYWDSKDQAYNQLVTYAAGFQGYTEVCHVQDAHNRGWETAKHVIPSKLYTNVKNSWDLIHLTTDRNAVLTQCLCHNDVHIGNWYQILETGKMGLTDFQCMARGHHSRDLAYLIPTAVTPEERRDWEKDVIQLYLRKLEEFGGPKVDFDSFIFEYRCQLWTALVSWTLTLGSSSEMISREEWQPTDICMELIRRLSTAIEDWNAVEAAESIRSETPRSVWND